MAVGCEDGFVRLVTASRGPEGIEITGDRPACVRGQPIRIQAGPSGSMQGPAERHWGYTHPVLVDWDGDGREDLLVSDIFGYLRYYRNVGTTSRPTYARPRRLRLDGQPFETVWRIAPAIGDLDGDGELEVLTQDERGYLTVLRRDPKAVLDLSRVYQPRDTSGRRIQLEERGGVKGSFTGRAKLALTDWFGRGRLDLLCGIIDRRGKALVLENVGPQRRPRFKPPAEIPLQRYGCRLGRLGSHTPRPAPLGMAAGSDLLVGADDGQIYYFSREYLAGEHHGKAWEYERRQ